MTLKQVLGYIYGCHVMMTFRNANSPCKLRLSGGVGRGGLRERVTAEVTQRDTKPAHVPAFAEHILLRF